MIKFIKIFFKNHFGYYLKHRFLRVKGEKAKNENKKLEGQWP